VGKGVPGKVGAGKGVAGKGASRARARASKGKGKGPKGHFKGSADDGTQTLRWCRECGNQSYYRKGFCFYGGCPSRYREAQ
jgi:hypothetical protein